MWSTLPYPRAVVFTLGESPSYKCRPELSLTIGQKAVISCMTSVTTGIQWSRSRSTYPIDDFSTSCSLRGGGGGCDWGVVRGGWGVLHRLPACKEGATNAGVCTPRGQFWQKINHLLLGQSGIILIATIRKYAFCKTKINRDILWSSGNSSSVVSYFVGSWTYHWSRLSKQFFHSASEPRKFKGKSIFQFSKYMR